MNIPRSIEKLIKERTRYAELFNNTDLKISDWCIKNNINTEMINGNKLLLDNPILAEKIILKDISEVKKCINCGVFVTNAKPLGGC